MKRTMYELQKLAIKSVSPEFRKREIEKARKLLTENEFEKLQHWLNNVSNEELAPDFRKDRPNI